MAITLQSVLTHARTVAKADTNSMPDAQGIILANDAQTQVQMMFIKRRRSFFLQESTRDITAAEIIGGSSPGKFLFPPDMWFLESVEYNPIDTTQQLLYKRPRQFNIANTPNNKSTDWLRQNQSINQPLIDIRGDWFEIFPTPIVVMTLAFKIFYYLQETDFVSTGDTVAYPFSLNYYCLSFMIAARWSALNKKTDLAAEWEAKAQEIVDLVIDMIENGVQTPMQSRGLQTTGYQY